MIEIMETYAYRPFLVFTLCALCAFKLINNTLFKKTTTCFGGNLISQTFAPEGKRLTSTKCTFELFKVKKQEDFRPQIQYKGCRTMWFHPKKVKSVRPVENIQ